MRNVPAILTSILASLASAGTTTRVSVSSTGAEGNQFSQFPSMSADGRFVAFQSDASNLVPGDTNGVKDIFVHDRVTGATTRVSLSSTGAQANGDCIWPAISADGRVVSFQSFASNLVGGDLNETSDIFVHDRQTGQTTRVSVDSTGGEGNGYSTLSALSAEGRFVAFSSYATNLVPGDTNGVSDVFLHDRLTGQTVRVSVDSAGREANGGSGVGGVSADGQVVAFQSTATNLVRGDTNGVTDAFVRDLWAGTTERVSVSSAGLEGNGPSGLAIPSSDGRLVSFNSLASNLVPGDTNGVADVFVHDRETRRTERVSVSSAGEQANMACMGGGFSPDGRFVGFASWADNLVQFDDNRQQDVFLHDLQTGWTTRVSIDSAGGQGNLQSPGLENAACSISAGARSVAFSSLATNLVHGQRNLFFNVYVHDLFPLLFTDQVLRAGGTARLALYSPDDPGNPYVMAASIGYIPGLTVFRFVVPLNPDALFWLTFQRPDLFQAFSGNLDGRGVGQAFVTAPAEPSILGLGFFVAFVTHISPATLPRISNAWRFRVEP